MKVTLNLLLFPLLLLASDLDLLYDDSEVAIIEITIAPEAVEYMYQNVHSDSMHLATMHFTNAYIDETIENVGFRLRGNTSRNSQKKSFKVSFNSFVQGRKFYDVEKLNLNGEHNDPSIMRSKINWDHYQKIGVETTRAAHCALYINDIYYGLYISIEHIDDEFLTNHFEDDSGNLWKCLWPADLTYRGPDPDDYHPYSSDTNPYELKTNTELYDYGELARFIDIINNTPAENFADSLEQVLVVPEVLKYAAVNVLTGNWDDYWFLRNNYYLYHEPAIDRFHWIPYDNDNSLGIDWFNIDWTQVNPYTFETIDSDPRPLMENIMANAQYRNLYTHFLEYFVENITDMNLWETRLDSLKDMITPWAELDTFRTLDYGFTLPDFHQSFSHNDYSNQHVKTGIKQFINQRHASLTNQLGYLSAPPIIYDIEYWPLIPGPDDSIYVSVAAFSPTDLDSLQIAFHPGHWAVVENYPMYFTPTENPATIEEADRWLGVIPPIGDVGFGSIQVWATDQNGESMVYPRSGVISIQVPVVSDSPLKLNEFLASNSSINTDDSGEYDDWLEIYNSGPEDLYLSGYYLTDDPDHLTKWMFPMGGIALEAGGFLLVWCDEDQEQMGVHTNFKLSREGEFVALVAPDGVSIIESINFEAQETDVSYGRLPDGGETWQHFMSPTPGATNTSTHTENIDQLPQEMKLSNFPNPFNAQTIIRYELTGQAAVNLSIMDVNGRVVKTLINDYKTLGGHEVSWQGLNNLGNPVSAGIYFIQLEQGSKASIRKILLLK